MDERLLKVTDEGKRQLELLVETLKAKRGNPDWDAFTDWVVRVSGVAVTKDVLYRTSVGTYKREPTPSAMVALSRVEELTYLDSSEHPTLNDLFAILLGELDAYGKPVDQSAVHEVR